MMQGHLELTTAKMRVLFEGLHQSTINVLAAKGIDYNKLRSALVPRGDRSEAAFIFDSMAVTLSWYGPEVMRQVLPSLGPRSTQSVLHGVLSVTTNTSSRYSWSQWSYRAHLFSDMQSYCSAFTSIIYLTLCYRDFIRNLRPFLLT